MNGKLSRINREIKRSQMGIIEIILKINDQNLVSIKRVVRMISKEVNNCLMIILYHRLIYRIRIQMDIQELVPKYNYLQLLKIMSTIKIKKIRNSTINSIAIIVKNNHQSRPQILKTGFRNKNIVIIHSLKTIELHIVKSIKRNSFFLLKKPRKSLHYNSKDYHS